jgi:hypothetical protein
MMERINLPRSGLLEQPVQADRATRSMNLGFESF